MARTALAAMGVGIWFGLRQHDFIVPPAFDGKLWLVFLLPVVYCALCVMVLRE